MGKKISNFIRYHLPAILYAGLIIFVSSLRNLPTPDTGFISFDKFAHLIEYALFAILIFRSFSHIGTSNNNNKAILASFLFLILFAISDEIFQKYIPGRTSDLVDILSDTFGAGLVLAIFYLWNKRKTLSENDDINSRN